MARITRRNLCRTLAAASAGYWFGGGMHSRRSRAANEELRFACIGVGGQGRRDTLDAARAGRVVAICDVDQQRLRESSPRHPNARTYTDWRRMLDDGGGDIDAVTISTPDHGHAPMAIRAMKMGLHCFCQKPLTHTVQEARLVGEVARQTGVATQMGNQGTASSSLRQAAAFIRGGGLGDVREIHVWTNRPAWPQGIDRPSGTYPVPDTLDWDVWIGPAPMRPYAPDYHPFHWRGWWDFGGGALGDMGSHTANLPYAACDLRAPRTVQAITSGHNRETYPSWSIVTWEFPATDVRSAVRLKWYDGGRLPSDEILAGARNGLRSSGAAVIGSKDTLYAPGDFVRDVELIGSEKIPEVDYVRSPGHFQEWVDAIRGGRPAMSNFPDYAGPLTETILLGNVAVWAAPTADSAGKKIRWDAENVQATNAAEVMHIVRKRYRRGFGLEG